MYSGSDNFGVGYALGRDSTGSNNNGNGWGMDGWWGLIIILALFGYGGFGGWGGGFGGGSGATTSVDASLQRGFDTQSILGKLDGINSGLCDGFYSTGMQIANGVSSLGNAICNLGYEQAQLSNATNMAIMQNQFATQTGINGIQTQIADCCCTTQRTLERGFSDTNYNMATNTCALQTSIANSTRDIIDSQRDGTRAILDYLCQEKIADLQAQNQELRLAASQEKQNNYLVNTLRPCPSPAYITCNPFTGTYGYPGYGSAYNGGCGCNTCGC